MYILQLYESFPFLPRGFSPNRKLNSWVGTSSLLLAGVGCIYSIRTKERILQYSFLCIHGGYLTTHSPLPPPVGPLPSREAYITSTWHPVYLKYHTGERNHKTESFPKPSQATFRIANPGYKFPFHSMM